MSEESVQRRRTVVFVSHYHEHLRGTILPICQYLKSCTSLIPIVLLRDDPGMRMASMCESNDVETYSLSRRKQNSKDQYQRLSASSLHGQAEKSSDAVVQRLCERSILSSYLSQFKSSLSLYTGSLRQARLLQRLRAAVLVVPDDRTVVGMRWISAARRLNVPTMTIQWAAFHQEKTLVRLRAEDVSGRYTTDLRQHHFERIASRVPGASRIYEGRRAWFIDPVASLSLHRLGAFPRQSAFVFGGGQSSIATFFGAAWKQRTVDATNDATERLATGHPDQDRWHALAEKMPSTVRRESFSMSEMDPSKVWITMIMPALNFFKVGGPMAGEATKQNLLVDFEKIAAAILTDFPDAEICVKPHPRDSSSDFEKLNRLHGSLHIVENIGTDELVRASDVILSQWSTVAMTAMALMRPLVIYDFYGSVANELFENVLDAWTVGNLDELRAAVGGILNKSEIALHWQHRQNQAIETSLLVDGNATSRISKLISSQAILASV